METQSNGNNYQRQEHEMESNSYKVHVGPCESSSALKNQNLNPCIVIRESAVKPLLQ